jgi:hypothetical protein
MYLLGSLLLVAACGRLGFDSGVEEVGDPEVDAATSVDDAATGPPTWEPVEIPDGYRVTDIGGWGTDGLAISVVASDESFRWLHSQVLLREGDGWSVLWESMVDTPNAGPFWSLHAAGPGNIWVAGAKRAADGMTHESSFIGHYDGGAWTIEYSSVDDSVTSIRGLDSGGAVAVGCAVVGGACRNGIVLVEQASQWSSSVVNAANDLAGVWGSSPSDIYVAGWPGLIAHSNAGNWDTLLTSSGRFFAVWDSDAGVMVGGSPGVYVYNGAETPSEISLAAPAAFYDSWTASPSLSYVAGCRTLDGSCDSAIVLRFQGTSSEELLDPPGTGAGDIWASSSGDLWIGSAGGLYRMSLGQ